MKSVFEMAEESRETEKLSQELSAVKEAMAERPKFLDLLQNPFITREEKRSLIEGMLGPTSSRLAQNFLNLLVDKNRIDLFPAIMDRLHQAMNQKRNVEEAVVVSARQLHPSILQLIQKALETAIKKKVLIRTEQDSDLLGGLQIRFGSRLIDGSIRAKLNALYHQLSNVKV
ncbi:MAG: ATP synthase F1 subunit delta [Candidatus Omnitrophica bacterium]|nr:ATP synthase F1 subunit delta [Candidatus Omnitrophota bacterium]